MTSSAKLEINSKATRIEGDPISIMQLIVTLSRQVAQTIEETTGKSGVNVLDKVNSLAKAELVAGDDIGKYVDELKKNGENPDMLDKAVKAYKGRREDAEKLEALKKKMAMANGGAEIEEVLEELMTLVRKATENKEGK